MLGLWRSRIEDSTTASSLLKGGDSGQCGGFGGGGAIGQYGGGGGGGYSGGGGGRGGGGGGSYVRDDGVDIEKAIGNESNGSVMIEKVHHPYPDQKPEIDLLQAQYSSFSGYSSQYQVTSTSSMYDPRPSVPQRKHRTL